MAAAVIRVVDDHGRELALETNAAGNFYSAEALAFPLQRACVERAGKVYCMRREVPSGSCNSCHSVAPRWTAPGKLVAP